MGLMYRGDLVRGLSCCSLGDYNSLCFKVFLGDAVGLNAAFEYVFCSLDIVAIALGCWLLKETAFLM